RQADTPQAPEAPARRPRSARARRLVSRVAALIYADTHVVAWLYAGRPDLIPPRARRLIEDNTLLVSPMVALELEYLFATGRTSEPARTVLQALSRDIGLP